MQVRHVERINSNPVLLISYSLLEAVGRHRAAHIVKSSGKKSKKRKRMSEQKTGPPIESKLLKPEILRYLTVGLNTTSRRLETEAALSNPGALITVDKENKAEQTPWKRLAVVFLPKPKDNLVYAHLPLLCYTCSVNRKDKAQQTRLVLLDPSCERTIATAMGLPRAGVIGVFEDAPGAAPLLEYVRENVNPVEVPWLEKALSGQWMGINVETHIPGQV
jgi:ribonuclease P/MRP protein subunit POP3